MIRTNPKLFHYSNKPQYMIHLLYLLILVLIKLMMWHVVDELLSHDVTNQPVN